ncbi:MAG: 50S ribosomal protein L6 [Patescibacteria group bacterium]
MSRIGKKLILIPSGVELKINGLDVAVKGPKGSLSLTMHPAASASITEEEGKKFVKVEVKNENNLEQRAIWGLTGKLIFNMVEGVVNGYEKKLEISGVGFRASIAGNKLKMELGFSHPVEFELPVGITGAVEKNVIKISGIDKQLVGEIAARIRKIKKPEPYKGKGIKYSDEVIRRKAGKAAKAAA